MDLECIEIFAQIQDFCRNPRFSPKSKIFAETWDFHQVQDFHQNPKFSAKSLISIEIRDFRRNPRFSSDFRRNSKFSPKSEIFAKNPDFRQNANFVKDFDNPVKAKIFAEIWNLRQNPRFSRKSEIFATNRNFNRNLTFSPRAKIFGNFFESVGYGRTRHGRARKKKIARKLFWAKGPKSFFESVAEAEGRGVRPLKSRFTNLNYRSRR